MISVLFYLTQSIVWVSFFSFGFLWNWSVGNYWVNETVQKKHYKYSLLKMMTAFHGLFYKIHFLKDLVNILPAMIIILILDLLFNLNLPWVSTALGSFALVMLQKELKYLARFLSLNE